MQIFVCGKFIDRYILANRFSNIGVVIEKILFDELLQLSKNRDSLIPKWFNKLIEKFNCEIPKSWRLNDVVLVRKLSKFNFGKASYEITESCNYKCGHCYLGKKLNKNLSTIDKKKILELIEKSGCLWLQITGGEPLICEDFVEIYSFAYSLGFLITLSTNGSLLTTSRIAKIISAYPPYRLAISMYGATANSYEKLTQMKGSFQQFINGLEWAERERIRTRLNIIVTQYNKQEIDAMKNLAKKFGFECFVFSKLSPTLEGFSIPIEIMAQDCKDTEKEDQINFKRNDFIKCKAGKTFFHVNSLGKASICKVAREPNIDLLSDGLDTFDKLHRLSDQLLELPSECEVCLLKKSCFTCAPRLLLYQRSKILPSFVCDKYGR